MGVLKTFGLILLIVSNSLELVHHATSFEDHPSTNPVIMYYNYSSNMANHKLCKTQIILYTRNSKAHTYLP